MNGLSAILEGACFSATLPRNFPEEGLMFIGQEEIYLREKAKRGGAIVLPGITHPAKTIHTEKPEVEESIWPLGTSLKAPELRSPAN